MTQNPSVHSGSCKEAFGKIDPAHSASAIAKYLVRGLNLLPPPPPNPSALPMHPTLYAAPPLRHVTTAGNTIVSTIMWYIILHLFIYLLKYIYTGYTHSVKYCYYNMALLIQYNTILHVYLVHTITNKMKIK